MSTRFVSFILCFLWSSSLFSQTQNCFENLDHPGFNSMVQVIDGDTIYREYILHIPANYDPNIPTALLINYHGFGDCASYYAWDVGDFFGLNAFADDKNFIVAYPQAAYRPEKEDVYWEPGDSGVEDIFKNDSYFTEQMIQTIASSYNVDLNKVFVVGFSNGGMLSYSIACNRGDLVAAAGVVSGAMLDDDCNDDIQVPLIIFHGIADESLPYEGDQYYMSVAQTVDYWLDHMGIPASSLVSSDLQGGNVVWDAYSGGANNNCLSLYTVYEEYDKEAGHIWFSEAIDGKTPNEILWDFFNSSCSPVNSIDLGQSAVRFNVSPNPFSNVIRLSSENLLGETYRIYNSLGQLEKQGLIDDELMSIHLSGSSASIYLLEVAGQTSRIIRFE